MGLAPARMDGRHQARIGRYVSCRAESADFSDFQINRCAQNITHPRQGFQQPHQPTLQIDSRICTSSRSIRSSISSNISHSCVVAKRVCTGMEAR